MPLPAATVAVLPRMMTVGVPEIADEEAFLELAREVLRSRRLSNNGPMLGRLETALAEYLHVEHCVCVSSCTLGLQIAARALALRGEVITTPFTFCATIQALEWCGLRPVFADTLADDDTIDPSAVERAIGPETTAILGVHLWGRPCRVHALESIARERGLTLIYDSAHAFGSRAGAAMLGGFGACEVFSFHATKLFQTFEGGAVTTNDEVLAWRLRQVRDHGHTIDGAIKGVGTNGKMSEIHAAMGIANLGGITGAIETRRSQYLQYFHALHGIAGLSMRAPADGENCQYAVVRIHRKGTDVNADAVLAALRRRGIGAKRYFCPEWLAGSRHDGVRPPCDCPNARIASEESLVLPSGQALSPDDIDFVAAAVIEILDGERAG